MSSDTSTDTVGHIQNPWVPTALVIIGSSMVMIDSTIVNVALHAIGEDLGALRGIEWVATSYLLAVCIAQPMMGWIADHLGRKKLFIASLFMFTLTSVLCALSPSLGVLIFFRFLQGLSGGVIGPLGTTMVLELFPREMHAKAMGVAAMSFMMTPALGPSLGGLLVTKVSWHWMFLINVPIGVALVVISMSKIPEFGHRETRQFDFKGWFCGSAGLALFVLALMQGNTWGWRSASTLLAAIAGVLLLITFVTIEFQVPNPMLELRIIKSATFRFAMLAMLFMTMAQYGRIIYVPLQLESLRDFTPLRVGVMLMPAAVFGMIASWKSAWVTERYGARIAIATGGSISCIACLFLSQNTLNTNIGWLVFVLTLQSFGMGLAVSPAMATGMSELPPKLIAQGSTIRGLSGQVAGALAVGMLGAIAGAKMGANPSPQEAQDGYNFAFIIAAVCVAYSVFLALRIPKSSREHLEPGELPFLD